MPGRLQVSRGSFQREGQSYAPLSCCTLARDGAAESHSCLSLRRTDAREGLTQHTGTLHLQRGHKTARGTKGPNPALQRIQALPRAWCALKENKGSPGLRVGHAGGGGAQRGPGSRPRGPPATAPHTRSLTDVLHHHRVVHRYVDCQGAPRVEDSNAGRRKAEAAARLFPPGPSAPSITRSLHLRTQSPRQSPARHHLLTQLHAERELGRKPRLRHRGVWPTQAGPAPRFSQHLHT